jgi:hypothetical protein
MTIITLQHSKDLIPNNTFAGHWLNNVTGRLLWEDDDKYVLMVKQYNGSFASRIFSKPGWGVLRRIEHGQN